MRKPEFPIKDILIAMFATVLAWFIFSFGDKAFASEDAPCVPVAAYIRAVDANDGVVTAMVPSSSPLYDLMILSAFPKQDTNSVALVLNGCVLDIPIFFPLDSFEGVKI